jgi:Kef-type K+ transport system membrane component KefB
MTLSTEEFARLLLALTLLLAAAHAAGYGFARLRQPRVIGEILGGLLLGPTVFDRSADAEPSCSGTGPTPVVLDALYQLGLLLLMFGAGAELRSSFQPGESRTVCAVTVTGMVVPFAVGLGFVALLPAGDLIGPAQSRAAFVLVFSLAIAVTSIPVISRIMSDLGIQGTPFARIVLAVAVIEDVIVYVILAIAIGLVTPASGHAFGLQQVLRLAPGSAASIAYHVAVTLTFLAFSRWLGPRMYRSVRRFRFNLVRRGSPIGFQLAFMLAVTVLATLLGEVPLFGAFLAGIAVSASASDGFADARESIRSFALAFFIPLYFAMVGLRLDLLHGFSPLFFVLFFSVACIAWRPAYGLARGSRARRRSGLVTAVALNARAAARASCSASVALDRGIISQEFYAALVLLRNHDLAAGRKLARPRRPLLAPRCASDVRRRRPAAGGLPEVARSPRGVALLQRSSAAIACASGAAACSPGSCASHPPI